MYDTFSFILDSLEYSVLYESINFHITNHSPIPAAIRLDVPHTVRVYAPWPIPVPVNLQIHSVHTPFPRHITNKDTE